MSETSIIDLQVYIEHFWKDKLNVIYDIGASDGNWSEDVHAVVTNKPKYYLFEAHTKYADQKHDFDFEFHNVVFSDTEKEVDFYANGTGGDSYYKEFTEHYDNVAPVKRSTVTLDKYCEENNIPLPDLIKIDTQGSELDILVGGQKAMANAKVIILECPLFSYNDGAPGFIDYLNFMRHFGFLPEGPTQLHWYYGVLHQIDIAFKRFEGQQ